MTTPGGPQPPQTPQPIQGTPASNQTAGSVAGTDDTTPPPGTDPDAWSRAKAGDVRGNRKYNNDQKRRILYNFIVTYENSKSPRGAFIRTKDNKAYLFDGRRNRLYRISPDDELFGAYLWQTYGLNHSESDTRHLIASFRSGALYQGNLREVRRFTYWDNETKILYISRYDGTCYVISGSADVEVRPNGYGPALFLDDDDGRGVDEPVFFTAEDDNTGSQDDSTLAYVGNHHLLFRYLIDDLQYVPTTHGGMSPETQKTCLGIWIFAMAFPDLMPVKPFLLLEGGAGSGKTFTIQRIAMALHGKSAPIQIPKKEDPDFAIKILRSPIAILDDINTHVEWLQDSLATYATGGRFTRRKLYTDDAEVDIRPQSFLAITTNNPATFRQEQLVDRCLIIRLERRSDNAGFTSAHQLLEQINRWRSEIFGEWLYWLNEIVAELRKPIKELTTTKYRLADFAHLAYIIGGVLSRESGPPGAWSRENVDEMLEAMHNERQALQTDGDQLVDLLDKWLDNTVNQGREVKINDLWKDLTALAKVGGTGFFKTPKSLASRIRELGDALKTHFKIERKPGPNGLTTYVFRRDE